MRRWARPLLAGWGLLLAGGPPARGQAPLPASLPIFGPAADSLDYAPWRLAEGYDFDEDGDSSLLAPHWRFDYPWGRTLGGMFGDYYVGQEVNQRDGTLRLGAHRLAQPRRYRLGASVLRQRYTAGMLYHRRDAPDSLRPAACAQGGGFGFGLFELRGRLPTDTGSYPAFWLFGNPDEVDIFEGSPSSFGNNVHLHAHAYWRPGPVEESECSCNYYWPGREALTEQYHRFALAWLPDGLTFYFDGVPIRRETRFRPLGCTLVPIVNLAMLAWANPAQDSLEVDYLRIHRPRRPLPVLFGTEAERLPTPGFRQFPRAVQPERSNPPGRQHWQVRRRSPARLELALTDNLNPTCGSTLPLPTGPVWCPAWVVALGAPPPALRVVADTAALHWAIADALGRPCRAGQLPAAQAQAWVPPLADLPPGAYRVRLALAGAVRYQPLFVVARPAPAAADQRPTSGQPAAD